MIKDIKKYLNGNQIITKIIIEKNPQMKTIEKLRRDTNIFLYSINFFKKLQDGFTI